MTKDQKIAKLGKEITDRATVLLGKDKITPNSPEYLGINSALKYTAYKYDQKMADDILDICLTMKKRVPLTIEQGEFGIAFAIAAILMALTVIINLAATLIGKYYDKRRSI